MHARLIRTAVSATAAGALLVTAGCSGHSSARAAIPAPRASTAGSTSTPTPTPSTWPGKPDKQGLVLHGSRATRMVALTFDADMTPQMLRDLDTGRTKSAYEKRIIDTLEATHTPATIFATGMWIEKYPQVTRQLAADPLFEFGNHTYRHYALKEPCYGLPAEPASLLAKDLARTTALLDQYAPGHTPYFRFPGGCYDAQSLRAVAAAGMLPIQWDVISGDAYMKSPQEVAKNTLSQVKGGSIIIMHLNGAPNAPATWAALPDIIKGLQAKGLQPVKVSTLLTSGSF